MTSSSQETSAPLMGFFATFQRRRQLSTWWGLLLTLAIFLAVSVFLFVSISQLYSVRAQLSRARDELRQTTEQLGPTKQALETAEKALADSKTQYQTVLQQKQSAEKALADSQSQIETLRKQLSQIFDFKQHVVPINEVDEKMAYSAVGPRGFEVLQTALHDANRKLPFNGANTPALGFTSPGYAQYLLSKVHIDRPVSTLKLRVGAPRNGDIITYEPSYQMFYFNIPELHKEFVIGMTPEGVLALDPKFGTKISTFVGLQP